MNDDDRDNIEYLINNEERKLTIWELDFLDSIQDNDWITERQLEVLNRIWEEKGGKR